MRTSASSAGSARPAPSCCPTSASAGTRTANDLVSLLSNEYELIRVHASRFLIAVGHELLPHDLEQVVATHAGYQVVEKGGAAGALAERLDPRVAKRQVS